jgi:hypothetical protein
MFAKLTDSLQKHFLIFSVNVFCQARITRNLKMPGVILQENAIARYNDM